MIRGVIQDAIREHPVDDPDVPLHHFVVDALVEAGLDPESARAAEREGHEETRELLRRVVMDFAPDCGDGCLCSASTARKHLTGGLDRG